uniref:cytochrome P450 704C1-like n=1 Tax=Erigeron canadensis TaxID=72917 RepID=UPI001CB8E259|nr:cytochrome P450 704C1-like [Erigeron canadensis]
MTTAAFMDIVSNSILISTLFLVLGLLYYYYYYIYDRQKTNHHGKKKKYHPTGATLLGVLINYNTGHHFLTDLAAKYKTYRIAIPFQRQVLTSDPKNVEYILKTNFKNYGKGKHFCDIMKDLLGDGIFAVDGDQWREQRKITSHVLASKVLKDYSSEIFRNNTFKLRNILSEAANTNQTVDINDLLMKATMDSLFKVAFGVDLDNMSNSTEESAKFTRAFDDANTLIIRRLVDITWKIKKFLNIGSEAELTRNMKVIDEFVYKVIQLKIQQTHNLKDESSTTSLMKKNDILSTFVESNEQDPKYLRDIILNYVLAGKDPIAIAMVWFIYMLCKHPEIQEKVARDIKTAAVNMDEEEEITNIADFDARVSEAALEKMQYLHAALSETIRLYPPLPLDVKTCFSDDVLPDGYNVQKGDNVLYLPYAMGKMKFIWGDDALEFKPERWLDQDGCFHPESPYKFTAFQGGPRICLGRDFAYRQLKTFSALLIGCFVFRLSNENNVRTYRPSINLHVDGPLQICVFNRFMLHKP